MYFHIRKTPWSMHNPSYDYFGDVDRIYMGPKISTNKLPITEIEDNNFSSDTEDVVLSFTWYKHIVKKGDTNRFGFKMHHSPQFERLPLIKDVTPVHETYPDPYNLIFNLTSYNNKTVRAGWSKIQYDTKTWCNETFTPHDGIITGSIVCSMSFGESNVSEYYAVAEEVDDNGNKVLRGWEMLNSIVRYKEGSLVPILNLTTEPNNSYNASDTYIYIDGIVDDERYVKFYYQYDNEAPKPADKFFTSKEFTALNFHTSIPIPPTLSLGTNHTIKIWVTDDQLLSSKVYNKTFQYESPVKPLIRSVFISDERLKQCNEQVRLIVYGEGVYIAEKKIVQVYIKVDGKEQKLTTFESSPIPVPFAGFYNFIPSTIGHHCFEVYTKENGEISTTATLIVWDPNTPQPPINIGKFVDRSSEMKQSSKSLFNLHYIDINQREWNTTLNDEGFYCKFRTYKDSFSNAPIKEYELVHDKNGVTIKDDFEIKFTVTNDPNTKFTLAQFKVTNHYYFARKFDLLLVSDSDLANNEESITYEQAESKIVVKSKQQYVSYTVFTNGFDNSPVPNRVFVAPLRRKYDDNLNGNVYWENSQQENATVYGMSWTNTVIPGKGSLVYTIAFAALGKVKSPTRLVDNTRWIETYNSTDDVYLNVSFVDFDGDEKINLKVIENGGQEMIYPWSVSNLFQPKLNFSINNPVYKVSIQALDQDATTRFPSNTIEKIVYLKPKPKLSLIKPSKVFYTVRDKYYISGNVTGVSTTNLGIYYRYLLPGLKNSKREYSIGAERPAQLNVKADQPFTLEINFDEIWPIHNHMWKVRFYAKDDELISNIIEYNFNLIPYNPPELKKVEFSKKAARQGQRLVGYFVVQNLENDNINMCISIDNKDKLSFREAHVYTFNKNPNDGKDITFAFSWIVPKNIPIGTHNVYFFVKDSKGIKSKIIGPKILVITTQ